MSPAAHLVTGCILAGTAVALFGSCADSGRGPTRAKPTTDLIGYLKSI
jgi:hypothetical protein